MGITERPGRARYVAAATKVHLHGDPATENGWVGRAMKQVPRHWNEALTTPESIAIGERFLLRTKGIHGFSTAAGTKGAAAAGGTLGQGVYIRPTDDTLHLAGATAAGDLPFGRVAETPSQVPGRGVPPNVIRIDLDDKDTLALV